MAVSVAKLTPNPDYVAGNKKIRFRTVTFDDSYATGGEALTAANVGLKKIQHIEIQPLLGTTDGWIPVYDYTNSKIIVLTASDTAGSGTALPEVDSAVDLSSYSCRVRAEGY